MNGQEVEKGLKVCEQNACDCNRCPYVNRGCWYALKRDALRYIQLLKADRDAAQKAQSPKNRENGRAGQVCRCKKYP